MNGSHALDYFDRGWKPIPLCWPTSKKTCGCGGGHPPRVAGKAPLIPDWQNVSPTRDTVQYWWEKWPNANIGILLSRSNLLVVDADSREAVREVEFLGAEGAARSSSGRGAHFFFSWDGRRTRIVKRGKSKRIDILSSGYIIAPPSVHRSGRTYSWVSEPLPSSLPPPPAWVTEFLQPETAPEIGGEFEEVLARNHKRIPRRVLRVLLAEEAEVGKRSDTLWWLEHELSSCGVSAPDIYALVKGSVWNKFKGRRDEEKRLRHEIARAVEGKVLKDQDEEPRVTVGLRIENFNELMSDLTSYPGWLVQGFWTRRSHGIVAGEPKTFKSTLTLDLAISVASGKPFLGKFATMEQGPVLIVQNENAPWILKDRMSKILASRQITGEVQKKGSGKYQVQFAPSLPIYFVNQQGFNLLDPIYQKTLERIIQETGTILLILDPLYLMFDGDVNSAKDLNPVLSWLLELKNEYNMGVLVVHHMHKQVGKTTLRGGQRMLGSTTLHGWVESGLYISVNNPRDTGGDDFLTPGAPASITIEREFRGAGMYPKIELMLKMGEFGEDTYEVFVGQSEVAAASLGDDQIDKEVLNVIAMTNGPASLRKIVPHLGIARSRVQEALKRLSDRGIVTITSRGAVIRKG